MPTSTATPANRPRTPTVATMRATRIHGGRPALPARVTVDSFLLDFLPRPLARARGSRSSSEGPAAIRSVYPPNNGVQETRDDAARASTASAPRTEAA